jgi:sn-glycerol 3-phosphate transport system ATP-binding protein
MASLKLDNIVRRYGKTAALEGIDLEVPDGTFCVVVGPSGCGKSTLLRVVAGLDDVDSGTIRIGGDDVTATSPRERDVAFVFQSYALYPHLSVRGNLEFPLRVRGMAAAERDERVREAAELLRITELLERKPRELSGGQRQRVAIGRAVVRRPRLFLFDEPLSNLDARLRSRMRLELVELHRRLATTSLYVTHDQAEAMTLAEMVVVIDRGRIHQVGTPRDVYDRPADRFVADFVGSPAMNVFEGEIVGDGGKRSFAAPGLSIAIRGTLPIGAAALGVRPEDIVPGPGPLDAAVRLVENLGSEQFVYADSEAGEVVYRLPDDAPPPESGERVTLAPRDGRMHWFVNGRRVESEEP